MRDLFHKKGKLLVLFLAFTVCIGMTGCRSNRTYSNSADSGSAQGKKAKENEFKRLYDRNEFKKAYDVAKKNKLKYIKLHNGIVVDFDEWAERRMEKEDGNDYLKVMALANATGNDVYKMVATANIEKWDVERLMMEFPLNKMNRYDLIKISDGYKDVVDVTDNWAKYYSLEKNTFFRELKHKYEDYEGFSFNFVTGTMDGLIRSINVEPECNGFTYKKAMKMWKLIKKNFGLKNKKVKIKEKECDHYGGVDRIYRWKEKGKKYSFVVTYDKEDRDEDNVFANFFIDTKYHSCSDTN